MPWRVNDVMTLRQEFVGLACRPEANIRQLCQRFGISPTVGYKWLKRYRAGGWEALADRSRRPHNSPAQTGDSMEQTVVALRREHPVWGGRKLHRRLKDLGYSGVPAPSTITDILHRHGLIKPEDSQAAQPFKRFERSAANQLWQVDYKGYFSMRQGRCHPLGVLDDHSRYNVLLAACDDQKESTVRDRLIGAFRVHGLPDQLLWDNGPPWGGAGQGYTALDVWLMRLGIRVCHGRAYHPQTQGKEERFHRTLQAEVLVRGGWSDCAHVQQAFDHWRQVYNTQRPHEALGLDTPLSRYQPSQRSYPEVLPAVDYAREVWVRRVDRNGRFSFQGRLWKAGRAFIGQPVGVRPTTTEGIMEVLFMTQLIKQLDLRCPNPE